MLGPARWPVEARGCSRATEELLDEDHHLALLDRAGVIFVEGGEHLVECLVRELIFRAEVSKGVLDKLLSLLLVEGTASVDIVRLSDLVDHSLDCLFFWSSYWIKTIFILLCI